MALKLGAAIVGVKPESTAYTFDTPAVSDCFPAYDISINPEGQSFDNPESTGSYGKQDGSPGPATMEIGFKMLLRGQGTAFPASVLHHHDCLLSAGAFMTEVGGTPITAHHYKPGHTFTGTTASPFYPDGSYSCAVWYDGVRYAAKGGFSNLVINYNLGQPPELAFTFKGAYEAKSDEVLPVATGVSSEVAPMFLGATAFQVHSYGAVVESFSIDFGNVLTELRDAKDANGILGYELTDRRITGTITVEDVLEGTNTYFADWRAGNVGNLATGVLGSTTGNKIALTASRIQMQAPTPGDRDKLATLEIPFWCNIAGGGAQGSDLTLAIT